MENKVDPLEELRRQEVLAEIDEEKKWKKNPEDNSWLQHVMNNLVLHLPNQIHEGGSWQMNLWPEEIRDIPHNKINPGNDWSDSGHSALFLNQTPREYLQTLRDAIEKNPSVKFVRVLRLTNLYFADPDKEKAQSTLYRLYSYLLPVYVELRMRGYNWQDISG
jgi:hypothetical protein